MSNFKLINNSCTQCSNNFINQNEECDDGNLIDLDGCDSNC